jgi:8-oxo-dGTP pyrophosphatase MutT (NUDIX family)
VKDTIIRCLEGVGPAADPAAAALGGISPDTVRALFPKPLVNAAVLVPIVMHPEALTVLLTLRTDHLKDHPGQIGFPGGRIEPQDKGPLQAALREAEEEIGLAPDTVQVAGYLEPHAVVTGFAVTPVVGFIEPAAERRLDAFEVAEAFEVPLSFFLDTANLQRSVRRYRRVEVPLYEYHYEGRRIWGATAEMLKKFINLINNYK